jgi:hypothetical protein
MEKVEVEIIRGTVAGGKPVQPGNKKPNVIELPADEAKMLIAMGKAIRPKGKTRETASTNKAKETA